MVTSSVKIWRNLVRAYTRGFPLPFGKRLVMESLVRLYEDDREEICVLPGGARMRVDLREHVQRFVYFLGAYEIEAVTWLRQQLREGMTFLDIGAHVGQYTLIAARAVGDSGHVHSFEPNPVAFCRLNDNIALNKFHQVETHPEACSSSAGAATLYMPKNDNLGEASLQPCFEEVTSATIASTTLDEWSKRADIGSPPRIDLMKIDVQGYEARAIGGAHHVLERFRPTILCEFEERWLRLAGTSSVELKNEFLKLGYEVKRIAGRRLVPVDPDQVHYFENLVLVPKARPKSMTVPAVPRLEYA